MSYLSLFTSRYSRFLNRDGHHSDASVMGEIIVQRWTGNGPDDLPDHPDEVPPYCEAFLRIRDCTRAVGISIELATEAEYLNTIEKLERLAEVIRQIRDDLPKARGIFQNARDDARAATGLRKAKAKAKAKEKAIAEDRPAIPGLNVEDSARLAFLETLEIRGGLLLDERATLRRKALPVDMGSRGPKPFPSSPFASRNDL